MRRRWHFPPGELPAAVVVRLSLWRLMHLRRLDLTLAIYGTLSLSAKQRLWPKARQALTEAPRRGSRMSGSVLLFTWPPNVRSTTPDSPEVFEEVTVVPAITWLCPRETIIVTLRVACWSFLDGALGSYRIAAGEVPS